MVSIIPSVNSDNFTSSFSIWILFISFSSLIAVARVFKTMLNKKLWVWASLSYDPEIPILGLYPKPKTLMKKDAAPQCSYVHSSIIYNSQDMETTRVLINRWMGEVYIYIYIYTHTYIYSPWGHKESDATEKLSLSHKYIYTPTYSRRLKDACSLEGKLWPT
jgi:hypothetical protein